jgi:hypothetical protein
MGHAAEALTIAASLLVLVALFLTLKRFNARVLFGAVLMAAGALVFQILILAPVLNGLAAMLPGGIHGRAFLLAAGGATVAMVVLIGPAIEEALRVFFNDYAANRGATRAERAIMGAQFGAVESLVKLPTLLAQISPAVAVIGLVPGTAFAVVVLALPFAMHCLQTARLANQLDAVPAHRRLRFLWTGHALYNGSSVISGGLMTQALAASPDLRSTMLWLSLLPPAAVLAAMLWNYRRREARLRLRDATGPFRS